jgi:regulatory protein
LKSIKQLKDYLKKKEYPDEVVGFVIDKLCEYKYLDDYIFAKSFVLTYSNKYGKLKLISQLRIKGVDENIIDDVFNENKVESNIESVARKYLRNKNITNEIWLKLSRFLYSRGYEFEDINRIIEILKEDIC